MQATCIGPRVRSAGVQATICASIPTRLALPRANRSSRRRGCARQCFTCDTWTDPMYALMAAFSPLVFLYFFAIVILGGFFVVNLFLAVIFQVGSRSCRPRPKRGCGWVRG